MTEAKKPRGRPPKPPEEKLERGTVFFTAKQWEKINTHGIDWLRKLIEQAKSPK